MANKQETVKYSEVPDDEEYLLYLREAPIEDFVKYMGGDLALAVQLRIDEAVFNTYEKVAARQGPIANDIYDRWASEKSPVRMEVTVRPIAPQGNLYGFASVKIGGMTVHDFKIVENKDGELFVGMPSKPDKSSKTGYRNTVNIEQGFKSAFDDEVIRYYYAAARAHSRDDKPRSEPENPPRVADQIAKAAKEAAKSNVVKLSPDKEKTKAARDDR